MRRVAQAIPESAGEVGGAESGEGGEIARSEGRVQVGLDVRGETADLPWWRVMILTMKPSCCLYLSDVVMP